MLHCDPLKFQQPISLRVGCDFLNLKVGLIPQSLCSPPPPAPPPPTHAPLLGSWSYQRRVGKNNGLLGTMHLKRTPFGVSMTINYDSVSMTINYDSVSMTINCHSVSMTINYHCVSITINNTVYQLPETITVYQ